MPDEDELEHENLVEDVLLVDTLMGWDGDPCQCPDCGCRQFRDAADNVRCLDCREGRHWRETTSAEGSR